MIKSSIKLSDKTIAALPADIGKPSYNRPEIKTGIVHIGVGSFHRSHEAFYTDQVLESGEMDWGICGISLLDSDKRIHQALAEQNGLYTLITCNPDGSRSARVIGSITELIFAPGNPGAAIEKIADPSVKIITMTITEGGYNFDAATGEFLIDDPAIQHDLEDPANPVTVFGYLTRALKLRRDRGISGLTFQSCDNIVKNGDVLKKMLLSYVREAEAGLEEWILENVTFPNSMVDRITPVTRESDIENLKLSFGIEDNCPVICEPYIQWVVEDNYLYGRPSWETAGVRFVNDVGPYEKMKISLLNAGHSLLGFTGTLYGLKTIDEAVHEPSLRRFLRQFMDAEVTPLLGKIEGIDIEAYKDSLLERFGNSNISDQLSRICSESSAKIPKFLMPTISGQLVMNVPVRCSALILAAWCRYLELAGTPGNDYLVNDAMGELLRNKAQESAYKDPLAFLKVEAVFGRLADSRRFTEQYFRAIDTLRKYGIKETIDRLNADV